ncbi:NDR1/HIN1-like protein 1 [Rhodamnia argentea]|uniref:NDR1/HIN1-like protein 1 n=1 Tax=Rhodamnia argentea TaxID=178133 RepID=A0ABM3GVE1_9MYRT|nr:NDR1/HIN1-like protein 1 [Rhodamnia argentea]
MSKCPNHGGHRWSKIWRRVFVVSLVVLFIILLIVLITWAILHPHKPRFTLQDATVYAFNASASPSLLTSTFQVTISSRNPNDNIAIYYDRLEAYATFRDQQITLTTLVPPTYQDTHDVDVWSPFLYGVSVPISPYNAAALTQDQNIGFVALMIKLRGKVRWRVGSFTSGGYSLFVNCPAYITFGSRSTGIGVGNNAVKYQLMQTCSVSV